ncbi:MAG TPA: hypothetical protein DIW61_14465 [Candidatus Aminicenantes bacterium]|nr:hypothetical protein [Candidatus Aminicenantes bacterium]
MTREQMKVTMIVLSYLPFLFTKPRSSFSQARMIPFSIPYPCARVKLFVINLLQNSGGAPRGGAPMAIDPRDCMRPAPPTAISMALISHAKETHESP